MKIENKKSVVALLLAGAMLCGLSEAWAQNPIKSSVQKSVELSVPENMGIGKVNVKKVIISSKKKTITVQLSENFADIPSTPQSVKALTSDIKKNLGGKYANYSVVLMVKGHSIEDYFVNSRSFTPREKNTETFIVSDNLVPAGSKKITEGLVGNNIAMWQSHGWYFEPKLNRWEWQRARIFQTVEDLYTQSYVIPYLIPMLENAGAYVFSPRERDTNTHEIIIDNEGEFAVKGYEEKNGKQVWSEGNKLGFAYNRSQYENNQNPFSEGTYRVVRSVDLAKDASVATWNAEIPEEGNYAVYISYKSLPTSTKKAHYTVCSEGDTKIFTVNQQMGGGTWIYLGHFPFKKGVQKQPIVTLSNYTGKKGEIVSADAVKVGGGMGNIARKVLAVSENVKSSQDVNKSKTVDMESGIDYQYQLSGYPRFTEGARYWLQWAGIPDSIYSPSGNVNDYTDDYRCRGIWVNYLAGGSSVLPGKEGLKIPIDLSFAFHSDAGTTMNDSIIGTLGIYYSNNFDRYSNGVPRIASRKLTDLVMTNIVNDIRAQYEPNWTRRGMWDKSYYEARVPEVPAMLLELLSHQNFADMKYGLDPNFRFTVSRAIYKGMLQFIAERDGRDFTVQPLPVNSFVIKKSSPNKFLLSWKPTADTLCSNADAEYYMVYERINDGAFHRVAATVEPVYAVNVNDNDIHSYRIVAVNKGGVSFPSETLALGVAPKSNGDVLVVNGFTRVSAPDWFDAGSIAGFYDQRDHGVPYVNDISFIGSMFEFRRNIPWMDDDAAGFGASRANYETKVIAGNTFDYTAIHGAAIMAAGYSFVSSSLASVESGDVNFGDYNTVDLILGKQKETMIGRGAVANRYKIYSPAMQKAITDYAGKGGNIFISGAYVASDLWDKENALESDKKFAADVLGYKWRVGQASITGEAYSVATRHKQLKLSEYSFSNELNEKMYAVESPDSFYPADDKTGSTFMRYAENNLIAGIVSAKSGYKTCVIGFPFETVNGADSRANLMKQVLDFFNDK